MKNSISAFVHIQLMLSSFNIPSMLLFSYLIICQCKKLINLYHENHPNLLVSEKPPVMNNKCAEMNRTMLETMRIWRILGNHQLYRWNQGNKFVIMKRWTQLENNKDLVIHCCCDHSHTTSRLLLKIYPWYTSRTHSLFEGLSNFQPFFAIHNKFFRKSHVTGGSTFTTLHQ